MMPSVVRENEPTKQRLVCAFAAVECKQTNGIDMIIAVSNVNNSKPPNGHLLEKERTNKNRLQRLLFHYHHGYVFGVETKRIESLDNVSNVF